ncbi:MAG TPA: intersectin-EH binding protein Ibp1 [Mycobacterium sp.]|uniref:intersectin-EH binding protein Ibp1 n=1 Tax=Mycolicibacterium sp. TaxID=2320850 RepID=UPI0025F3A065|nr:intersectin-EH binding protein Ibp1 [Mycolicibacterium sp.]HPX37125.1 intersectin-EH binding protein Ibp1 [Mycobacterium sp.]HQC77211.1 intersectin-EH binding protein Ibp1 [Mycobacterium sp.]
MATLTSFTQRVLIAGGFALAVTAAPLVAVATSHGTGTPLAACPAGEVQDQASGACKPVTDKPSEQGVSPINPEQVPLQPNEVTSSRQGDVGSLPEVDGIPCNANHGGGGSTGQCIGLSENQNEFKQPKTSISSSP